MEKRREIKDGHIVVKNPLYQELPTHEITIQSGRTLYHFTGSYDGSRSLPHKVLRLMLSDDYEQEQEELREKLLRLNEEINEQEEQAENIDRFIDKVQKYLDLDELTPAILNDMVKAVYVHAPDKSKGYREQQIDISYDLVGILPASLLNSLQNGETA